VQRGGCTAFRYAAAEMQGWRTHHEDSHSATCDGSFGSFWVLDGHGGAGASAFAAPRLSREFMGCPTPGGTLLRNGDIAEVFESLDRRFKDHVRDNPQEDSGSTVVGALVAKGLDGNYTAKLVNCGDSRGVLVRAPTEDEADAAEDLSSPRPSPRKGVQVILPSPVAAAGDAPEKLWPIIVESVDHKPNHPVEKARIEAAGGYVLACEDPPRLDGNLAVSRGMGDFEYKVNETLSASQQKVSCIPDIYEVSGIRPGSILVLACDGIWDVMSSQEAAIFVRDKLVEDPKSDLGDIAGDLLKSCLGKGSRDNMTVMLIHLDDGSDVADKFPSDEMKNGEKLLDIVEEDVMKHYRVFLDREPAFPREVRACAVCGRWFANPNRCPCKAVTYCSKHCQKKGWKEHKLVCTAASKPEVTESPK